MAITKIDDINKILDSIKEPNIMKLTKQQLPEEELIYSPDTVEVETFRQKHDVNMTIYVSKIGDKYYKYGLEFSYNEGCVTFDYSGQDWLEAEEVRPVKVETTKWEKVTEKTYEQAAEPGANYVNQ